MFEIIIIETKPVDTANVKDATTEKEIYRQVVESLELIEVIKKVNRIN